jgi:hypothetical protein
MAKQPIAVKPAKPPVWAKNFDADGLDQLEKLGTTIEAEFLNGNSLMRQSMESYVRAGMHLSEARLMFKGDKEFGQWRQHRLPSIKQQWARNLMQVADRFGERLLANDREDPIMMFPVSSLVEMVNATDDKVEEITGKAEVDGKPPKQKEVRRMVKDEDPPPQDPEPDDRPAVRPLASARKDTPAAEPSMPEKAQQLIQLSPARRLSAWDPDDSIKSDPFAVLGMGSRFSDNLPNSDVVEAVGEWMRKEVDEKWHETLAEVLDFAHDEIIQSRR